MQSVSTVVDSGPMVALFVVDGLSCDGGHSGADGWFWVPPIESLSGAATLEVSRCQPSWAADAGPACTPYAGSIVAGRVYARALLIESVIAEHDRAMF